MSTSAQKIKTRLEARRSKLINKKEQLKNMLRSRERLDYEIINLKKSIAKDQKKAIKEQLSLEKARDPEAVLEAFIPGDTEDSLDPSEPEEILDCFQNMSRELDSILTLLLRYDEDL